MKNDVEYCMFECKQKFTAMENVSNVIPFIGVGEFDSALFRKLNLNWDAQLSRDTQIIAQHVSIITFY